MKKTYFKKTLKILLCMCLVIMSCLTSSNSILATSTLSSLTLPNIELNSSKSLYDVKSSLFDITLESASNLTASLEDEIEIKLGIEAPSLGDKNELEVLFLVDTSFNLRATSDQTGSQNLHEAIKWATYKFANNFMNQPNIKIGLITYNSNATLNIQLSSVEENRFLDNIQSVMDNVPSSSSKSDLRSALQLAYNTFSADSHINKQIVLLSDEHQVVSNSMKQEIDNLKSKNVELYTFGISQNSQQSFTKLQSFHNEYTDNNSSKFYEVPGSAIWNLEKYHFPAIVENIKYSVIYGANITSYEIIFLMDTSTYMSKHEYKEAAMWSLVKLAQNYYDNPNVKSGLITYDETAISVVDPTVANYFSFEKPMVDYITSYSFNSNKINIRDALKLANEKFSSDPSAYKQIVLVGHDNDLEFNVTDDNYDSCTTSTPSDICIVQSLQNKKVDLFTYTMGRENNSGNSSEKATLREVHSKISNSSERYYYELYSHNDNYYILEKKHFIELANLTKQLMSSDTTIGEIELDLNNNFILVNQNSNKISVQITYGKKISISFKVKATQVGQLTFGDSYFNVNGQKFKLPLPTIYIQSKVPDNPSSQIPLNGTIRILEIQPGDSFQLKGKSNLTTTGIDTYDYNGIDVLIDHVSMPEFIGKIAQLNGYYDVIVIGNNSSWDKKYSQINFLGYSNADYNENDITKRKAEEIISFINSGQLVYIDESILTDNNLKGSNLYQEFKSISADNFKKFTTWQLGNRSALSIDKIIIDYMDKAISKSPKFSITKLPTSDINTNETSVVNSVINDSGNIANRNMEFELNIPNNAEGYQLNLYLDINGDGLYKEDELAKTIDKVTASDTYQFTYEMDPYFVGQLDWKIELVESQKNSEQPVKSYQLGTTYFKSVSNTKQEIKVLQIYSYKAGFDSVEGSNLYLDRDESFRRIVGKQNDYDIIVESIPASLFDVCGGVEEVNGVIQEKCYYKDQERDRILLNGHYDMVIFGFGDAPATLTTDHAINEVKSFIASGQSVMLTHDTIGDKDLIKYYQNRGETFANAFRVYVGQARFKSGIENIKNLYQSYDSVKGIYDYLEIPLISIGDKINNIEGLGTARISGLAHTSSVYKTNESLITTYPFSIENINVAQTHRQYLQLNLEDPDVVPWLNLSQGGNSGYDSKNEYYTYSKGNITFSGTGHSDGYTDDELKLFVNTIVKAGRGANHAPTIESSLDLLSGTGDATTGVNQLEVTADKDIYFSTVVRDIDGDDVTLTITINDEVYFDEKVTQGNKIDTRIPADAVKANQPIMIKLEALDKKGAEAVSKNYQLNPVSKNQPTIHFTSQNLEYNVLAGDEIDVTLTFDKLFDNNNEIQILGATLNDDITPVLSVISQGTPEECGANQIALNYKLKPIGTMDSTIIGGKLTYKISEASEPINIDFSFTVSARSGIVKIELIDTNGKVYKYPATAKLSNNTTEWDDVSLDSLGMNRYEWTNKGDKYLTTATYNLDLELPNGYQIHAIKEGDTIVDNLFNLSYDHPTVSRTYIIGLEEDIKPNNEVMHGLDEGILDNTLQITEGTVKLIPNSFANLVARIQILHKEEPIYLYVDKKFKEANELKDKIKVYKWENNELVHISEADISLIEDETNSFCYKISVGNTTMSREMDIVIKYPVELTSESQSYINNIVYRIESHLLQKEFRIETAELPDLF